jgi:hypothetical protein
MAKCGGLFLPYGRIHPMGQRFMGLYRKHKPVLAFFQYMAYLNLFRHSVIAEIQFHRREEGAVIGEIFTGFHSFGIYRSHPFVVGIARCPDQYGTHNYIILNKCIVIKGKKKTLARNHVYSPTGSWAARILLQRLYYF